jgi:ankyrin repeat protein
MHRLHCLRTTARCASCGVALPAKDLPAHIASAAGSTAELITFVARGDASRIGEMLQHGSSARAVCDAGTGDTLIHCAARHGQISIVDLALRAGAGLNSANAAGETALHIACSRWPVRSVETNKEDPSAFVRYLLERGCDADARTLLGDTPMQIAQRRGFNDALLLLAKVGGALRPVR